MLLQQKSESLNGGYWPSVIHLLVEIGFYIHRCMWHADY